MSGKSEIMERVSALDPAGAYVVHIWTEEDVLSVAAGMRVRLTDEQLDEVMGLMEHKFDAEVGMNWTVIKTHIRWVLSKGG